MPRKTGKRRREARWQRIVSLTVENVHNTARGRPVRLVCKDRSVIAYHAESGNRKKLIKFDLPQPGSEREGWREGALYEICGSLFDAGYHIKNRDWMGSL